MLVMVARLRIFWYFSLSHLKPTRFFKKKKFIFIHPLSIQSPVLKKGFYNLIEVADESFLIGLNVGNGCKATYFLVL